MDRNNPTNINASRMPSFKRVTQLKKLARISENLQQESRQTTCNNVKKRERNVCALNRFMKKTGCEDITQELADAQAKLAIEINDAESFRYCTNMKANKTLRRNIKKENARIEILESLKTLDSLYKCSNCSHPLCSLSSIDEEKCNHDDCACGRPAYNVLDGFYICEKFFEQIDRNIYLVI